MRIHAAQARELDAMATDADTVVLETLLKESKKQTNKQAEKMGESWSQCFLDVSSRTFSASQLVSHLPPYLITPKWIPLLILEPRRDSTSRRASPPIN